MTPSPLTSAINTYKALAHPARVRILAMLQGGELCVCQLIAVVRLAPSTISAHLVELKRAGLVEDRKEGKWVHVRLAEGGPAREVLAAVFSTLADDPQVRSDLAVLKKLRRVELTVLTRAGRDLGRVGISDCCPPAAAKGRRA
jgi:ArsR family transcriptional regulator, arsenate/arsenite/antimonite-responsive transcriptional repressor